MVCWGAHREQSASIVLPCLNSRHSCSVGWAFPGPADADRSVTATWEEVPGACLPALPPSWTVAHGQQLGNQG